MKKIAVFSVVVLAAIVFIAGCSKVNGPATNEPSSQYTFAQNVIPLNHGEEIFGTNPPTFTWTMISGGMCRVVRQVANTDGNGVWSDTVIYKKQKADTGYNSITKLEVLHVESSWIYYEMGAHLISVEMLLLEESNIFQGQQRCLRYVSGYGFNGVLNIIQDTVILTAAMFGTNPGPHGASFGQIRSIVLQEGVSGRPYLDGKMCFPHKITIAEEYAAGKYWNSTTGSRTICPVECEHFLRVSVCELGESPQLWVSPRPFLRIGQDSLDLGLDTVLVCAAKLAPIDSVYSELQQGDDKVYVYARSGAKTWEFFAPIYP
jgi:hypothetical protein